MELKVQTLLVLLLATGTVRLQAAAQTTDRYTDENRPYEFGFVIEGQQHRHEKKDEAGIITGEFGFITADGIYHVTVYATDENGDFKIISMKNVRVAPSPFGNPDASFKTSPVPIGNTGVKSSSPSVAISTQPPPPSKTASFPGSSTRPPILQETSTSPPLITSTKKIFKVHNGCSNCVIPTTTTTTTKPLPPPLLNRDNRPAPLPSKPGFPFSSSVPKGSFPEQPPEVSLPRGNGPVPSPQPVDSRRNFITPEDSPRGGQQPLIANVNIPRNQETNPKPPTELQPPISADKATFFPETTSGIPRNDKNTQGNVFTTKSPFTLSSPQVPPPFTTPGGRPPQNSFGVQPVNIPGSVSTITPNQTPRLPSDNSRPQFPNTNVQTNPSPKIPYSNTAGSVPPRSPQNPLPQTPNYNYPNTSPPITSSVDTLGSPSPTPNLNIPVASYPQNSNNYVPGKSSPQFPNTNAPDTPDSAISGIPGFSPPSSPTNGIIPPQTTSSNRGSLPPQTQPTSPGRTTPSPIGVIRDGPPPGVSISDVMKLLYIFNYTVGFHGHHESGYRNGDKQGGYFVNGRDGIGRNVNYVANEFGYQPNITLVNLGLNSPDTPKQDTEKEFGLKGYEFKWFPS